MIIIEAVAGSQAAGKIFENVTEMKVIDHRKLTLSLIILNNSGKKVSV